MLESILMVVFKMMPLPTMIMMIILCATSMVDGRIREGNQVPHKEEAITKASREGIATSTTEIQFENETQISHQPNHRRVRISKNTRIVILSFYSYCCALLFFVLDT